MKKAFLVVLAICFGLALFGKSDGDESEYQTVVLRGTADLIIDSTNVAAAMKGKKLHINNVYLWYDNGANTNAIILNVCRGRVNMATGAAYEFKWLQTMTSGQITYVNLPIGVTTGADSTIYFVVGGTATDSIFAAYNYKVVN